MAGRTISVNIPGDLLPEIDKAAKQAHRSRAAFVRDVLRAYLKKTGERIIPLSDAEPDEIEAVKRGRAEFVKGDFVRLDDLQRELGIPTR